MKTAFIALFTVFLLFAASAYADSVQIEALNGTLQIASVPTGANVSVNGTFIDVTPASGFLTIPEAAGTYHVMIAKSGYIANETDLIVLPALPTIFSATLAQSTSTLAITSTPSGATVSLNGVSQGTTPVNLTVLPGDYELNFTLTGYENYVVNVSNLIAGETRVVNAPMVVTPTNTTNTTNTTTVLVSQSAGNTTIQNNRYMLPETNTGLFTVKFNQPVDINWYLGGQLVRTTTSASSDTYAWNPGIMYADSDKNVQLTAVADGVTATFDITVQNDINVFWYNDVLGVAYGTIIVHTNYDVHQYSNVTVTLSSDTVPSFDKTLSYSSNNFADTEWKVDLTDLPEGHTLISIVHVFDNQTNVWTNYTIPASLVHYRTVTTTSSNGGGRSGGGGGGGIPYKHENDPVLREKLKQKQINLTNPAPEFVYAVFSKDVIQLGESIQLSLDAKDNEEVSAATATLENDSGGLIKVPLQLTSGSKGYGTWSAELSNYSAGKYTLREVALKDNLNKSANYTVADRSFYVLGQEVKQSEETVLVYAILDKSTIQPGDNVTIKLDARDFHGLTSITALIKNKTDEIPITMHKISGSAQYGTWEGTVQLSTPDQTYTLSSVTLDNGIAKHDIRVYGQKVYVSYVASASQNLLTGNVVQETSSGKFKDILRNPGMPLYIGLGGMALAMIIVLGTFLRKGKA